MAKLYRFTIEIEVDDVAALKAYANQIAIADNRLAPEEWADMRSTEGDPLGSDLQMILDPGESPPGTSIQQSFVEAL